SRLPSLRSTTPAPPATAPRSLHDALPISPAGPVCVTVNRYGVLVLTPAPIGAVSVPAPAPSTSLGVAAAGLISLPFVVRADPPRSEEHTSELQSRVDLVCRLLL